MPLSGRENARASEKLSLQTEDSCKRYTVAENPNQLVYFENVEIEDISFYGIPNLPLN